MIATLLFTITVEGIVVVSYSIWRKKPLVPILFAITLANLITQSFLWIVLNLFFHYYLIVLIFAEILIWVVESFLLFRLPANQLTIQESIFLSLSMNLASFALGWFLPI